MTLTLKRKIYNHYLQLLNDRIQSLQQVLADLKESGANETKSTAGDKHETALAMIQIEQANTRAHLDEIFSQKVALKKIDPDVSTPHITLGSLVNTNRGYLFLSVALGKATIDGIVVTALSPQSPLGNKLMGLKAGAIAEINNNQFSIDTVE